MNERIFNRKPSLLFDGILLVCLVAVALSAFLIFRAMPSGKSVRVTVGGETVLTVPLSTDGEYVLNGGSNVLTVRDGEASVTEANCPDRLCVNVGTIRRVGEKIVCLPNRLCVEIVGAEEEITVLMNLGAQKGGWTP